MLEWLVWFVKATSSFRFDEKIPHGRILILDRRGLPLKWHDMDGPEPEPEISQDAAGVMLCVSDYILVLDELRRRWIPRSMPNDRVR